MSEGKKVITTNKKASFDYNLLTRYEAGLVLQGSEIKSIRENKVNLREGFVQERNGELWLMSVHINTYDKASIFGHRDPVRPRKLLLHKKEIAQIITKIQEKGYTVVPTIMYLKNGRAKVEIAVAQGKKVYDKRADIAKKDAQRQIERALRDR